MRGLRGVQMAAGLALVFILVGATLSQARAGGSADLVIHARSCPIEYSRDNLFADCHDDPFGELPFSISGPESATSRADASGNVTFADLAPGSYDVALLAEVENAGWQIYCSLDGAEGTLVVPPSNGGGSYRIDIPSDFAGSVVCDWYFLPYCRMEIWTCSTPTADAVVNPTPIPNAGDSDNNSGAVTGLPNTGAGDASDPNAPIVPYGLGFMALGVTAVATRRRSTR